MIDRKRLLEDLTDYAYDAEQNDCDDSVWRRALDYIALLEDRLATSNKEISANEVSGITRWPS